MFPGTKDLTGQRFGRLRVVSYAGPNNGATWRCVCDCGGETVKQGVYLRRKLRMGELHSCGCHVSNLTHGWTGTRLYRTWRNMISRCYNPNTDRFPNYGGRGITVCDEWRNSFESFLSWAIPAGYTDDLTLERKDNNGDYCPSNCTWVSMSAQVRNRRVTRRLTWDGRTLTPQEWATELGVSLDAIQLRVTRGWPVERIFTQPFREPRR